MQDNEQIIPVKKPPTWLYVLIYGMGIGIVGMIIAIGYGLIVGFDGKKSATGETLVALAEGKKFPDFNIKLLPNQHIDQVEYENFRIIVYVKSDDNIGNLIIILSATNGNEIGRFVIGQ